MQKSIRRNNVSRKIGDVLTNVIAIAMAVVSFMAFNAICSSKFNFVNHLSVVNLFISLMPVIIFTGSIYVLIRKEKIDRRKRGFTMTKRGKMMYSGDLFEFYVGDMISNSIECTIKYNYRFYSPRINRGLECDVIVITPYKIYVVECKNYSSAITGKRLSPIWTFISSGKRGFVQNPVLLNDRRIRTMKGHFFTQLSKSYEIANYVCVPSKCKIRSNCEEVVNLPNLIMKITSDSLSSNVKYDLKKVSEDVDRISEVIK